MTTITILHDPLSATSRDFLTTLGVTIPEGNDSTVTIDTDSVRIVSDHAAVVTLCPAFPGYPVALIGDGEERRMLAFPASWDAVTAWTANPPAAESSISTIMTHLAFRKRFTFTERTAIETAAMTDPEVRTVQKDFDAAKEIDLTYPDLIAGISLLVAKGLLAQARADAILTS